MPAHPVTVIPPALLQAATSVAATAEQAATPSLGAVPVATPGSAADAALAVIVTEIASQSAKMSAELAGKGPQIASATHAGVAQLEAQDVRNAAQIQAAGSSSSDDWFTEPNWHDVHEPIDPGGAAAGPGAVGPIPHSVISPTGFTTSTGGDDWFTEPGWHDVHEPIDPGGAAAGPGAVGPIPHSVISPTGFTTSTGGDDWFTEPGWHDFNEPIDPGGAAAGPGAMGPIPHSVISPTGFTT